MGREARRRDRFAAGRCPLCETRTKLGPSRATLPRPDRSGESRSQPVPHGRVRRCDHQRSATEIIYERDVCRSVTPVRLGCDRFQLAWLVKERASANVPARNPDSYHRRRRGFVRRHFDDAASSATGYQRLHGFLYLEGEQASHDNYRSRWSYCSNHRHWSHSPTLQIHLWSSGTAHSRNGNCALFWNVVVARSYNRAARIPSWLCRRCLLIRWRSSSIT